MAKTWIYLIKDNLTGCYKIGYSKNPELRLKTLRREHTLLPLAFDFSLIEAWKSDSSDETKLHRLYSDKRVRGEWFQLDESDIENITFFFYGNPRYLAAPESPFKEPEEWEKELNLLHHGDGAGWVDLMDACGEGIA